MKNKVLEMLFSERDGFISGEKISDGLGITRAAVWKVINTIKSDGGIINAASGKGYNLASLPDLLKPEYLNLYLENGKPDIFWFSELDSTNNYLKEINRDTQLKSAVCIAEYQTGGKGRLGRTWTSASGDSIQMSFLIRPEAPPTYANAYNLAGALGICKAIEIICGVNVKIKWPNDIVYGDKKICGILTEMSTDMDQIEYIVFGAGVNVNQTRFNSELMDKAVSLRMITGEKIDRIVLCAAEIEYVFEYFNMADCGKIDEIMKEYREKSAIIGKKINVLTAHKQISGICEDFGENGELLININGEIKSFYAGEVSVRGETGYV